MSVERERAREDEYLARFAEQDAAEAMVRALAEIAGES